jgi:hypothetical protein
MQWSTEPTCPSRLSAAKLVYSASSSVYMNYGLKYYRLIRYSLFLHLSRMTRRLRPSWILMVQPSFKIGSMCTVPCSLRANETLFIPQLEAPGLLPTTSMPSVPRCYVSHVPPIIELRQLSVDGHLLLGPVPSPEFGSHRIILVPGSPPSSLGLNFRRLPPLRTHLHHHSHCAKERR